MIELKDTVPYFASFFCILDADFGADFGKVLLVAKGILKSQVVDMNSNFCKQIYSPLEKTNSAIIESIFHKGKSIYDYNNPLMNHHQILINNHLLEGAFLESNHDQSGIGVQ